MRLAVTCAAISTAAFFAVSTFQGGASAATPASQDYTSCNQNDSTLAVGIQPTCTGTNVTMLNPIAYTVTIDPGLLNGLVTGLVGTLLQTALGGTPLESTATWTMSCQVGGATVTSSAMTLTATFNFTGVNAGTVTGNSQKYLLSAAPAAGGVNSPEPTRCTIQNFKITALAGLGSSLLSTVLAIPGLSTLLGSLTISGNATVETALPGAIYANYPADSAGAHAVTCVDDRNNGNVGAVQQAFQCLSDQADYYTQMSSGQFVHNGLCMDLSGGQVVLNPCTSFSSPSPTQVWHPQVTSGEGQLRNASNNNCLAAPASGTVDGAPLKVVACSNALGQKWTLPGPTTP